MIVCTVIRKGKGIGTVNVAETNKNELAELMVGEKLILKQKKGSKAKGSCIEIENLSR